MPMNITSSNDTKILYQRLSDTEIGETATYAELSELVGYSVSGNTGYLATARKQCLREGIVFGVVRGVGVRRLNDTEIVGTASGVMTKIRRTARRGATTLTKVNDFESLPNELKQAHNANMSMLGAIAQMTKPSKIKIIESRISPKERLLSYDQTLELFKDKAASEERLNEAR